MSEKNCCLQKNSRRSESQIKDFQNRINRISGQLGGVKKMIDENRYCADILIQLSAINKAVNSLASLIMEDHLKTCVVEKITAGDTQVIGEVVELFKKFS